jgi:PKD repeat protein
MDGRIGRLMPALNLLTKVELYASGVIGTSAPTSAYGGWRIDHSGTVLGSVPLAGSGSLTGGTTITNLTYTQAAFTQSSQNWYIGNLLSYRNNSTTPDGNSTITELRFYGVGTLNPFATQFDSNTGGTNGIIDCMLIPPTATPTSTPPPPDVSCELDMYSGTMPLLVNGWDISDPGDEEWDWGDGTTSSSTSHTYNTPGTFSVTLTVTNSNGSITANCGSVSVEGDYGFNQSGGSALYRPLRVVDEDRVRNGSWLWQGYVDNATTLTDASMGALNGYYSILPEFGVYAMTGVANNASSDVFAMQAGHVATISDIQINMCGFRLKYGLDDIIQHIRAGTACLVRIDDVPDGDLNDMLGSGERIPQNLYNVDLTNVQLVTVENASGGTLKYIVRDARNHINQGDEITAGCIIGKTIPIFPDEGNIFDNTINMVRQALGNHFVGTQTLEMYMFNQNSQYVDAGYNRSIMIAAAMPTNGGESIQIKNRLVNEITSGHRCNDPRASAGCINSDPDFYDIGSSWQTGNAVFKTGNGLGTPQGGVQFAAGANAWVRSVNPITFLAGADVRLSIAVANRSGTVGKIRVAFGSEVEDFDVPVTASGLYNIVEVGIENTEADTDYQIYIQNMSQVQLEIQRACVKEGAPLGEPNYVGCFGADPYLDMGGLGWEKVGDAQGVSGQILLGWGGGIAIPDVPMYAENSATRHTGIYNLQINAELWLNDGATYAGSDPPDWFNLRFTWGSMDETLSYYVLENGAIGGTRRPISGDGIEATVTFPNQQYILGTEFEITENAQASFSIDALYDGLPNVQGLKINSICLTGQFRSLGDDTTFPVSPPNGNTETPHGGIGIGPLPENCSVVPYPTQVDIASWVSWHWYKLNGFLRCDLMVLLNRMYEQFYQFQRTVGYWIRWTMVTMNSGRNWFAKQIIPYVNAHMNNVVTAMRVNVNIEGDIINIPGEGGQPTTLGDVLIAFINMISSVIQSIADAISSITGIVPSILNFIISLLSIAADLLATALSAVMMVLNQVLGMITSLINFGRVIAGGLIVNWNAAPVTAIPMMPACDTAPQENIVCAVIYIADNTIFSPTTGFGRFFMPLLIGFASIKLVMKLINETRSLIQHLGQQI